MLLLRAVDPGDAVEQQLVVVARREPFELGARPVQQHRVERPDLTVHPWRGGNCGDFLDTLSGHVRQRNLDIQDVSRSRRFTLVSIAEFPLISRFIKQNRPSVNLPLRETLRPRKVPMGGVTAR